MNQLEEEMTDLRTKIEGQQMIIEKQLKTVGFFMIHFRWLHIVDILETIKLQK